MTFFPLPDEFYADPQFAPSTDAAIALWTRAASWSAHHLTDGFVPAAALLTLRQPDDTTAHELVQLRVWRRTRGGFQFVVWPKLASRAYVGAKRDSDRRRQANHRESQKGIRDQTETQKRSRRDQTETNGSPVDNHGGRTTKRRRKGESPQLKGRNVTP